MVHDEKRTLTMKVRDLLKLLGKNGWFIDRTRGDHRQMQHPTKPGTVTVSGHPSDDVHPKTLKSALRQAGLEDKA
jgi:predicted RNA binding protein YcfA (HicA-like mRNA interferase family)